MARWQCRQHKIIARTDSNTFAGKHRLSTSAQAFRCLASAVAHSIEEARPPPRRTEADSGIRNRPSFLRVSCLKIEHTRTAGCTCLSSLVPAKEGAMLIYALQW